jgi:hypothetical protein
MPVNVQHEGFLFSIEEMMRTGEQHQRDVAAFFAHGPCALDSITLIDPNRVFAMLSCYYKYPSLRTAASADEAEALGAVEAFGAVGAVEAVEANEDATRTIPVARLVSVTIQAA